MERAARAARSFLAIDLFAPLVHLLSLEAQSGNWPGVEPGHPDRVAGLFAISVGPLVDALEGGDLPPEPAVLDAAGVDDLLNDLLL